MSAGGLRDRVSGVDPLSRNLLIRIYGATANLPDHLVLGAVDSGHVPVQECLLGGAVRVEEARSRAACELHLHSCLVLVEGLVHSGRVRCTLRSPVYAALGASLLDILCLVCTLDVQPLEPCEVDISEARVLLVGAVRRGAEALRLPELSCLPGSAVFVQREDAGESSKLFSRELPLEWLDRLQRRSIGAPHSVRGDVLLCSTVQGAGDLVAGNVDLCEIELSADVVVRVSGLLREQTACRPQHGLASCLVYTSNEDRTTDNLQHRVVEDGRNLLVTILKLDCFAREAVDDSAQVLLPVHVEQRGEICAYGVRKLDTIRTLLLCLQCPLLYQTVQAAGSVVERRLQAREHVGRACLRGDSIVVDVPVHVGLVRSSVRVEEPELHLNSSHVCGSSGRSSVLDNLLHCSLELFQIDCPKRRVRIVRRLQVRHPERRSGRAVLRHEVYDSAVSEGDGRLIHETTVQQCERLMG